MKEHGGLEAGPGTKARVHENHRQNFLLQPSGDLATLDAPGESQESLQISAAPIFQGKKIALGH
jgi:hypothetical protein